MSDDSPVSATRLLVVPHEFLHVVGMVGYALLAEETTAVGGDDDVVFDTNSAEVLISLKHVEVEPLGAMAFSAPFIDEGGNEVDARLVGDHEALLQPSAHA